MKKRKGKKKERPNSCRKDHTLLGTPIETLFKFSVTLIKSIKLVSYALTCLSAGIDSLR